MDVNEVLTLIVCMKPLLVVSKERFGKPALGECGMFPVRDFLGGFSFLLLLLDAADAHGFLRHAARCKADSGDCGNEVILDVGFVVIVICIGVAKLPV